MSDIQFNRLRTGEHVAVLDGQIIGKLTQRSERKSMKWDYQLEDMQPRPAFTLEEAKEAFAAWYAEELIDWGKRVHDSALHHAMDMLKLLKRIAGILDCGMTTEPWAEAMLEDINEVTAKAEGKVYSCTTAG